MAENCNNINPLIRGGTSQAQRLLPTLQKDYVHIDEHSYADLLLFAKNFSNHLKYYGIDDQVDGTWETFFSRDVSILITFIADNDLPAFEGHFRELMDSVKGLGGEIQQLYEPINLNGSGELLNPVKSDLPTHFPHVKQLFDYILSVANHLDQQIDRLPETTGLKAFAQATIQRHCNRPFHKLLGYYKVGILGNDIPSNNYILINPETRNAFEPLPGLSQQYTQDILARGLSYPWLSTATPWSDLYAAAALEDFLPDFGSNAPDNMTRPEHVEQWLKPGLEAIEAVFDSLMKALYKITSGSIHYLEETLNEWPDHPPHIALYICFLKLFRFAQNNLNNIKERHLDYYYKEVLRLQERPAQPDEVFVILELAKQVEDLLLTAGTTFKAGKDSDGKEVFYDALIDTAINKAEVAQLKSSYYVENTGRRYTASIVNSADGEGEELSSEDSRWKPFGPVTDFLNADGLPQAPAPGSVDWERYDKVAQASAPGFAIASPNLYLTGGTRTVTLTFVASNIDNLDPIPDGKSWGSSNFKVQFTGEKGWLTADVITNNFAPTFTGTTFKLQCRLSADTPKVVPYDRKLHGGTFSAKAPMVQVLLPQTTGAQVYKDLKKLKITEVTTLVEVAGLKDFTVQNDAGRLDLSKPVLPFGATAPAGASLIIGSKEVFQKKLVPGNNTPATGLSLNITWDGNDNLANTYKPTSAVKVTYDYLENNSWQQNIVPEKNLAAANLSSFSTKVPVTGVDKLKSIGRNDLRNMEYSPNEPYSPTAKDGFIRLSLTQGFGQQEYPLKLSKAMIRLAKGDTGISVDSQFLSGTTVVLKDPPYIPKFKELTIDYAAESTFDVSVEEQLDGRVEQFFHLHAFGQRERHNSIITGNTDIPLLPAFDYAGSLYIGLQNAVPQQSVSVLFQVAEGSANPLKKKQEVIWHYLYQNDWIAFEGNENANINDQTNGLLQSGLITFFFPKKINTDNTWLDAGHLWLRAAVRTDADAVCDLIDVRAQAVRLQFDNQDNAADFLATPLAAETISKLLNPAAAVKKVKQPYTSFGGKLPEQPAQFHKRVSERLRHKDRAITIWDYEHLVLEAFPEIYKVKCLNHTQLKEDRNNENLKIVNGVAPGYVTIVAIPDLKNRNAVASLKPYTSLNTLDKIGAFLRKRTSVHVQLDVANPILEEIELDFQVAFREGKDFTLFSKILNQDILRYLSPWAFESEASDQLDFGGSLHKSVVLDFIEELEYVDFVTQFKMNQLTGPGIDNLMDVEAVVASTPLSILVSAPQHTISTVINECV